MGDNSALKKALSLSPRAQTQNEIKPRSYRFYSCQESLFEPVVRQGWPAGMFAEGAG